MDQGVSSAMLENLAKGWRLLRLSVDAPQRIRGWDLIAITAASDLQNQIYERQVKNARRRGLIPGKTRVLCIPDPEGRRIGSGGATLNALRTIKQAVGSAATNQSILLIHAGGDSKRLPWASVAGKLFVPFPLQADPDHEEPTLFDHLLALTAPLAAQASDSGILLSLTGDVLPLFEASALMPQQDTAAVITTPASLDVAGRHGVIVANSGTAVRRLLQKPPPRELIDSKALIHGGAAKIDTGLYLFTGQALDALMGVATDQKSDIVAEIVRTGEECSLYEEIAWAMVPAHHGQLKESKSGRTLLRHLQHIRLQHHNLAHFSFVHLGASAEFLAHLSRRWYGQLPRKILAETGTGTSPFSYAYAAQIPSGSQVGNGSAILKSSLTPGVRLGNRCIVSDFQADDEPLRLPDNCCLWQVPVRLEDGIPRLVTLCCGVDDNPKLTESRGTFCNRGFEQWLQQHNVNKKEIWPDSERHTLWQARLFPALKEDAGLAALRWILEPSPRNSAPKQWRENPRLSMADLPRRVDLARLFGRRDRQRTRLVLHALREAVAGIADRNIAALAGQLPTSEIRDRAASLVPNGTVAPDLAVDVPASRQWQIRADLYGVASRENEARRHKEQAFAAVGHEVAATLPETSCEKVSAIPSGSCESVALPVRFDLAGGWSDTPPYCLERPASVLNFAMLLDGKRPVQVEVEALARPEWHLILGDSGTEAVITDLTPENLRPDLNDPFILLRTALLLTGYGSENGISQGIRLRSIANVPRGSGLGTSSILAAAVITALQKLANRPADSETISELVLNLEQRMTTGGGWQDQVGGLVPGIKFISSLPTRPLRLHIEPVPMLSDTAEEFQRRFVLAFSGQERLAKNVLQIVVERYLQRNSRMIEAVEGLAALAGDARRLLSTGQLNELGNLLREVWALHQQLDPHCSNPDVDTIFRSIDDLAAGYKLSGAGGGGFMGILAKDDKAASRIRERFAEYGRGLQVYDWQLT